MNWSDQTIRGQDFTRIAGQQAGLKLPGFRFDGSGRSFQTASCDATKVQSETGRPTDKGNGVRFTARDFGIESGIKQGGDWFNQSQPDSISRTTGGKSKARLLAAAMIARIPFPLSNWIAKCFHPARTPGLPL